jgi:hypothetical protein
VKIGRGVRKGCCLSPILINLYTECLAKVALEGFGGFKIGGQITHTLKYADHLVLLAKEEKVLQDMIDKLTVMRISRQPFPVKIMVDQKQLEKLESFKYLGSIFTNDGRCTCEIKYRTALAKAAFNKKRALFTSALDLELRKKLVNISSQGQH